MADDRKVEDGAPSQPSPHEEHGKISDEDEKYDPEDATRNMSFSSQKEAQEYERKQANALLANPLRGYSHAQLRKLGRSYALG
jgi:hypothetical protein